MTAIPTEGWIIIGIGILFFIGRYFRNPMQTAKVPHSKDATDETSNSKPYTRGRVPPWAIVVTIGIVAILSAAGVIYLHQTGNFPSTSRILSWTFIITALLVIGTGLWKMMSGGKGVGLVIIGLFLFLFGILIGDNTIELPWLDGQPNTTGKVALVIGENRLWFGNKPRHVGLPRASCVHWEDNVIAEPASGDLKKTTGLQVRSASGASTHSTITVIRYDRRNPICQ